jgi:hypothetical protein
MDLWVKILLIQYLIALSMDVHQHPGPVTTNTPQNTAKISFCNVNIRSLNAENRFDEFKNQIAGNFDVITVTETWLGPDHLNDPYEIHGYTGPYRLDRTLQDSGGVMTWVNSNIVVKRRLDLEQPKLELSWIELKIPKHKILVGTCYRQPDTKGIYGENFWGKMQDSYDLAKATNIQNIIIAGDFNADAQTDRTAATALNFFLSTNHMSQHIQEPTRITPTRASVLDLVITNYPGLFTNPTVTAPVHRNDHCTVSGTINFSIKTRKAYTRTMWNYKEANFDYFRAELDKVNWDECFETDDVDTAVETWTELFKDVTNRCIPHKKVTVRPEEKTWYNGYLRKLCRKQQRDHRMAKQDSNEFTWEAYKTSRNFYFQEVQRVKTEHDQSLANDLANDLRANPKKWWSTAKETLGLNKKTAIPAMVSPDGNIHNDDESKATLFNNYFTGVQSLVSDPTAGALPDHDENEQAPHLDNITATAKDVKDLLSILNVTKAYGPDDIGPRLLREAEPSITASLVKLFNLSLSKAFFPSSWKLANVVPIYKKAEEFFTANYRPISLLSTIAKVFERVVFKYLFNYFRDNFMISIWQSGFLPGTSTVTQLIEIYDQFCKAVSKGKDIRVVFLDISKAFDRVWHEGLIYKLEGHGIRGKLLKWLVSYLQDRQQRVIINGSKSEWASIKAGVPQGSVLGPLLFLIFINDITHVIKHCKIRLFADDTCLYIEVDEPEQAATSLNADLAEIQKWANKWLITFSPPKTEDLIISNKKDTQHPELELDGQPIKQVKSHKHLGVHLTNDLTWSKHAEETAKKANKMLGIIRPLKHKLDRRSLETLYTSFVRPVLEYADEVWDVPADNRHTLKSLDKVQKEAAKLVTGATARCTTEELNTEAGWQPLAERRSLHRATMMYKINHGLAPTYLQDLIPNQVQARTRYQLRNSTDLEVPLARLSTYSNSFFPAATRQWNSLTTETRTSRSAHCFKSNYLKQHPRPPQNQLYYRGKRHPQIMMARLRIGCSSLNYDLCNKLHVTDSPNCACDLSLPETAEHFFMACPRYTAPRAILRLGISSIDLDSFTTQVILYGNPTLDPKSNQSILQHVHQYITTTNRF